MTKGDKVPSAEQIRLIFRDTFQLYERYHDSKLFLTLIELLPTVTYEQAREIMADSYLLYKNNQKPYFDTDWAKLIEESNDFLAKHDNVMADWVAKELIDIIENYYKYKRYEYES